MRYEMTDDQLKAITDAYKPTPVMYLPAGKSMFKTPQENANHAWKLLGDELGFDHMTVLPVPGADSKVFDAEPKENEPPKPDRHIVKPDPEKCAGRDDGGNHEYPSSSNPVTHCIHCGTVRLPPAGGSMVSQGGVIE